MVPFVVPRINGSLAAAASGAPARLGEPQRPHGGWRPTAATPTAAPRNRQTTKDKKTKDVLAHTLGAALGLPLELPDDAALHLEAVLPPRRLGLTAPTTWRSPSASVQSFGPRIAA